MSFELLVYLEIGSDYLRMNGCWWDQSVMCNDWFCLADFVGHPLPFTLITFHPCDPVSFHLYDPESLFDVVVQ